MEERPNLHFLGRVGPPYLYPFFASKSIVSLCRIEGRDTTVRFHKIFISETKTNTKKEAIGKT